ncbi:hypothetical protein BKA69DRAFT_1044969 [Paraphysoderma sedebokerense]|nr:hypothetical protein BKA69DRAFT_1044969 [Paraphysoderma sedebokerense]
MLNVQQDIKESTRTRKSSISVPTDALSELDNRRIKEIRPLLPPQILTEEQPLSADAATTILKSRAEIADVIAREDDRLLVIVGPCSIHDPEAAIEYAKNLASVIPSLSSELMIVMRVYFEKPRTTVGWKGLINDPDLDNSFKINKGLRIARKLLLDINEMGIPCAVEFLDTISPQYIADTVSWGAIGARTTQSQVHRELASGLSMPVGFKNDTDGNVKVACDAIVAASRGHHFLSVTKQGLSAIVSTTGNPSCHAILRGGRSGTNYDEQSVVNVANELRKAKLSPSIMIDCSHGNSNKDHRNQPKVAEVIAKQLESTESGTYITGVMIESNLREGRQDLVSGLDGLEYGVSVTDACISWTETIAVLQRLQKAVLARRERSSK